MGFITRKLVSRISPWSRHIRRSSPAQMVGLRASPSLAQMGALSAFGRGFSSFSTSATSSVPFMSGAEFLANEGVKNVLAEYKKCLLSDLLHGLPTRWHFAESAFDTFHLKYLSDFDNLKLYSPLKYMTKGNYMAVYLRSTLDELDYLLYFLYQNKVLLEFSGLSKFVHCIRLSELDISHEASHVLRTDATVIQALASAGCGILLTGGKEPEVVAQNSDDVLLSIDSKIYVPAAELDAISKGLALALSLKVEKLRILCDNSMVVDLIRGKKVGLETEGDMMDKLCVVGVMFKKIIDYSCNHIFREQNLECDYFAAMGRTNFPVHREDLKLFTSVPMFRLQGDFTPVKTFPKIVFPVPPPKVHKYQFPANQPAAAGGGAPATAAGGGT